MVSNVGADATSSTIWTLNGSGAAAYTISVMVRNNCGASSFNKFIAQGSGNFWSLNFIGGMSSGGSPTATSPNTKQVGMVNPTSACNGESTAAFNYTLFISNTGDLTIRNDGNASRNYTIKIEKEIF